jgi:hypothetical protein
VPREDREDLEHLICMAGPSGELFVLALLARLGAPMSPGTLDAVRLGRPVRGGTTASIKLAIVVARSFPSASALLEYVTDCNPNAPEVTP